MYQEKQNLKEEFLKNIDFKELTNNRLPKVIVISFLASIGSGKTTISNTLSERLHIPVLDNDGIRRFINKKGYPGESPLQDLVIDIARTRMRMVLELGISYILDADLTLTYQEDILRMSSAGARLLLIKIDCLESLILERLEERGKEKGVSLADKQRYLDRQKLRQGVQVSPEHIFYAINSEGDLNSQINDLVSRIQDFENQ